jgi:D-sedoheptulose 7-phosphate isomerase
MLIAGRVGCAKMTKMSDSRLANALISSRIREHITAIEDLLQDAHYLAAVETVAATMTAALRSGAKILFFGNGGSAADAQHLAAELAGRFLRDRQGLPSLALTTNTPALTAIGNDYSFEEVFSRQIQGLGNSGDVAFAITTSGVSPNILRAAVAAREKGMITIGLTGAKGGKLRAIVHHCICIPSDQTPRVQEAQILTGHILCEVIERELFGKEPATISERSRGSATAPADLEK